MSKPLDPVKEFWPELEPLRKKFKVGTLVAYREPERRRFVSIKSLEVLK